MTDPMNNPPIMQGAATPSPTSVVAMPDEIIAKKLGVVAMPDEIVAEELDKFNKKNASVPDNALDSFHMSFPALDDGDVSIFGEDPSPMDISTMQTVDSETESAPASDVALDQFHSGFHELPRDDLLSDGDISDVGDRTWGW